MPLKLYLNITYLCKYVQVGVRKWKDDNISCSIAFKSPEIGGAAVTE